MASSAGSWGASRRSIFGASGAGPEPEVAVALLVEPVDEPRRRLLDAAVLGQATGELGRGFGRVEILEIRLLAGEQRAGLQLQQRRDQDEELAAGVEVELLALGQPLEEGEHDAGDIHLAQVELVPQDEREQQVEGTLERLEVELELANRHRHQ